MGFNKWYVPDLPDLKEMYEDMGHSEFIKLAYRRDAFIGPTDSIDFINRLLKKEQEKCITSQKSNLKRSTKRLDE